ncbi:hypothetical protein BSKO_05786 [Bryopsis sp. KO-2023]|nr:hypothetical protein BSKO_05786 [Bryopsis sp. KO-2023]
MDDEARNMDDEALTVSPTKMTMIDWFREWPSGALRSVALDICAGVDLGKKEYPLLLNDVVNFSFVHECVEKISGRFLNVLSRCTSPAKYSDMLGTFIKLLEEKSMEIAASPRKFEGIAQISMLVGSGDLNSGGAPAQQKKLDLNLGKPGTYELPNKRKILSRLCAMMGPSQKFTGKSCLHSCGNQEAKGTETTIDEFKENTQEWIDDILETLSTPNKLVKEMPPQENLLVGVGRRSQQSPTGLDALREVCEREDLQPVFDEVDQVMVAEKIIAQKEKELTGARAMVDVAQEDLKRAVDALNCVHFPKLSRKDLVELKSLSNPPKTVKRTMEAVMVLLGINFNFKTKGKKPDDSWSVARKLLSDPSKLLDRLRALDRDSIKGSTIRRVAVYIQGEDVTAESVRRASRACTGIWMWVRAIYSYHHSALQVPPKRAALNAADEKVAKTMVEVRKAQAMMEDLQVFIQLEAKVQEEIELAKQPMSASHVENSMMSEVEDIAVVVPKTRQWPLIIDQRGQATKCIGNSNSASGTIQVIKDHGNMNLYNPDFKFAMTAKLRNPHYPPKAIVKTKEEREVFLGNSAGALEDSCLQLIKVTIIIIIEPFNPYSELWPRLDLQSDSTFN